MITATLKNRRKKRDNFSDYSHFIYNQQKDTVKMSNVVESQLSDKPRLLHNVFILRMCIENNLSILGELSAEDKLLVDEYNRLNYLDKKEKMTSLKAEIYNL